MDEPDEGDQALVDGLMTRATEAGDAVTAYELADGVHTDYLAWGCIVAFGGSADGDGLVGAAQAFQLNGYRSYITDAADALRRSGHDDLAALVDQALAEYEAAGGLLGEQRWEELNDRWNELSRGDIVDRVRGQLGTTNPRAT